MYGVLVFTVFELSHTIIILYTTVSNTLMKTTGITTFLLILFSAGFGPWIAAEQLTPEQLEHWFNDELKTDEERALDVNEGVLEFLSQPPEKPVHYIRNTITISKDSPGTGWVHLMQCHENLDAVAVSQIVYQYKRMRDLRVDSFEKIGKAWIVGSSVQLENVRHGAKLCIRAEVGILYPGEGSTVILKNGPFHRKFLDGYYPMHVSLDIMYPGTLLEYESINPAAQPGFSITTSKNSLYVDAWFEGELTMEVRFLKIIQN